ncbi:MAG: cobalt ECF transporter T component CbiQ [Treponema sp.]|nr:cobalt ECF transporter T component CbiQ [Treponema sp.]
MPGIQKLGELYALERLSGGGSVIHRLHPGVKILTTVCYMVTVISFDRYALRPLLPFLFYPSILIALGELPPALLCRRAALALPFCLFTGISNCVFERDAAVYMGSLGVSFGFISLCTLVLRTLLCVAAVLILIATTPWPRLSSQLRRFRVPGIFMTVFELCYRYIAVLLAEAHSMYIAYLLRSSRGAKGVAIHHMGSFVGCLFLRAADRAERVYSAMQCRAYGSERSPDLLKQVSGCSFKTEVLQEPRLYAGNCRSLTAADALFPALTVPLCVLCRFLDLPAALGHLIGRVLPS